MQDLLARLNVGVLGMSAVLVLGGCLSDTPTQDEESGSGNDGGDAGDGGTGGGADGDGDGEDGADGGGPGGDGGGGDDVSIYEIQKGEIAPETVVQLNDVVVTAPLTVTNAEGNAAFMIQEPDGGEYSGIYVFVFADQAADLQLAPGDVVNLSGEYREFFDSSQITLDGPSLEVVSSGPLPEPAVVNASDVATGGPLAENYESVLIKVEGVEVTNPDLGFGDFEVAGGLIVDDFFMAPLQPKPNSVFDSLTGVLLYSFEQFRLAPRSEEDVAGGDFGATPASIFDVQRGDIAENTRVLLEEVVVTTPLNFKGDTFYVQDPEGGEYSGIAVFASDAEGLSVSVGDVVTIEGTYTEFFDLSQIKIASADAIQRINEATPLEPTVVTAADVATGGSLQENYEGVLVQVEGVTVTEATNMFGEFVVTGGLRVDDLFVSMDDWPDPAVDAAFESITGVMTYGFEEAKLAPRTAADLVQ